MLYQLPVFLVIAWVGYADLKTRRITNRSIMVLLGAALLCQVGPSSPQLAEIIANMGLGLMLTLPGYFKGVLGGGDVKLLIVLSPAWNALFMFGSFAVGVILVGAMLTIQNSPAPEVERDNIPIGTCIAVGAWLLAITGLAQKYLL
ncbi:prepilin peptidase [Spongiibacter tropicus]|uniref:prepilin peptidase n=1 Tax=Spongiibacter tropicus TaxID=454602 RepID=UPI003A999FA4